MNKKREYKYFFILSILSLLFVSLFSGFVSAADSSGFIEGVKGIFGPISNALFNTGANVGSSGEARMFEAVLLALMIIAIVYAALYNVPLLQDNAFALWTVSIASAVLGVRFMVNWNWLEVVMIPQGVLGISLSVLIPFLVFFWFVEFSLVGPRYKTIRKICWAVYAVVWAFVWWDQGKVIAGNLEWLYPMSVIVAVIMLFLDGTMQTLLNKMKSDREHESRKLKGIQAYRLEMARIKQIFDSDPANYQSVYNTRMKTLGIQAYNSDLLYLKKQMDRVI